MENKDFQVMRRKSLQEMSEAEIKAEEITEAHEKMKEQRQRLFEDRQLHH